MSDALMNNYAPTSLAFSHGQGAWLYGEDGRAYLDFMSGIAVTALGHAHPHLVKAVQAQAATLMHVSNVFAIPAQAQAAQRLVDASFANRVFFCNSGAEALEAAIKVARRYHWARGAGQKTRVITLHQSFHGRTLATIAAAGAEKLLEGFGPPMPGFDPVPANNMNALRAAIRPETAAVLVEPVQGEGGIFPLPETYMRDLRAACDEFGLLLIFDEVQCGMARSGSLFAYEQLGSKPDIMALAKGLGGGFPVGAVLASEAAASGMAPGSHGSTFGGNPLAMAAVNAVLDVLLEPGFLDSVVARAAQLEAGLDSLVTRYPQVFERQQGLGLMRSLSIRAPLTNAAARAAFEAEGLLVVGASQNQCRLLPPLIISEAEVEQALDMLAAGAAVLAEQLDAAA